MTSAYGAVFEPAVRVIPLVLRLLEAIYKLKEEETREVVAREEPQRTRDEWQLFWQNQVKGEWTTRLIDNDYFNYHLCGLMAEMISLLRTNFHPF